MFRFVCLMLPSLYLWIVLVLGHVIHSFLLPLHVLDRDGRYNTTIIDTSDTDISSCSIDTWFLATHIRYLAHVMYFGVPGTCGTSVLSESLFSKAGEVVAARRSNIKHKNVDMILFLCGIVQWFIDLFCLFVWRRGAVSYGIVSYRYTMLILSIVSNRLCLVLPTSSAGST